MPKQIQEERKEKQREEILEKVTKVSKEGIVKLPTAN